jgi:transcriptional regulator with XRE-family HTH domain
MSTLSAYLCSANISQKAFAELVEIDKSVVSRLARMEIRPSLDLAFRIERVTNGAVPASSWVEAPEPERGAA